MEWQNRFTQLQLNPNDALPELIVSNLKSWKSILVTGVDRTSYLQGQLTCDLAMLTPEKSSLGAHCDAKGKVFSIFRCFNHNEGIALFHHASTIDTSLAEIKKYSVFSQVDIGISQDAAFGLLGKKAEEAINQLSSDRGNVRSIEGGTAVKIENDRWLLLINENIIEPLLDKLKNATFSNQDIWDKFDIENAIPRIVDSIQHSHIPQAFNLQSVDGISFSKGCYTGQETVARAKYRGTNKRYMAIIKGSIDASLPTTFELERSVGENWRNIGALFAHYQYADGSMIGLIILPNNLDSNTILRIVDQPNSIWQIEKLPYSVEEE